jgi:predicted CXXCH cytochrome family protein
MKKSLVMAAAVTVIAGAVAYAAEKPPQDKGREVMVFKMGIMELKFQHWKHQSLVKNDCQACHKRGIGVIDDWGKETAHRVCIPCHDLENKGPVQCHDCHGK